MADRIPAHGTPGRYQGPRRHNRWQACRCDLCRAAALRAAKTQELRRLRGVAPYVDRGPVAAHVQALLNAQWTKQQIANVSGVSRKTVWNVLYGEHATVQLGTAQALLTLKPLERPGGPVPAVGAMRRLHALAAMGWTLEWTSRQVGISYTATRDISSGRTMSIQRQHFSAIDRVYRQHAMRLGPSTVARDIARRKQWATAAAWDDIDDPNCTPDLGTEDPVNRTTVAAYRLNEIAFLVDCNVSEHEIAERLGMRPQYVHDVIRDKIRALRQTELDEAA
ncbi:hypothetical protein [Streptomyces sp. NPDC001268]|uniref:hypothetical protein n=1 Tax=Streptomyces sp. NPDC001268 TaxID=3364553 RepID=UPI003687C07C